MESVRKYTRILLNIIIPVMWILLVVFLGPKLLKFFLPFVIGWILASIANPLVKFLEKRLNLVRRHSSMLVVIAVLGALIGLIYFVCSRLAMEIMAFLRDLPALYGAMEADLREFMGSFESLFLKLPQEVQASIHNFSSSLGENLGVWVQKLATPTVTVAGNVAKGIPGVLVNLVVTVLSSYFFIVERDRMLGILVKLIPESGVRYYQFLKQDVKRLIGGYFLAQFRIMFVVAGILTAGFFVLQVKYCILWAILIALLDFLPVFGTGTALIPWAVVKLVTGEYAFAAGLVLIYVLTQVVRQAIQPKIVGDTIGLPPFTTLLFLYLGYKWAGIGGMILAVPLGMFVLNLYEFGAFDSLIENIRLLVQEITIFRKEKD